MDENKSASELNEALKGMWEHLTDEQRERAKECKSMDELMQLAGRIGVELPDEMLDTAAGGNGYYAVKSSLSSANCPKCGRMIDSYNDRRQFDGNTGAKFWCRWNNLTFWYVPATKTYYDDNGSIIKKSSC